MKAFYHSTSQLVELASAFPISGVMWLVQYKLGEVPPGDSIKGSI